MADRNARDDRDRAFAKLVMENRRIFEEEARNRELRIIQEINNRWRERYLDSKGD